MAPPPEGIEEALRQILSHQSRHDLAAAYLFGSLARGGFGPESDVDVAVLFRQDPPQTLEGLALDLEENLEQAVGRPVQLVVLNQAPIDLVRQVMLHGRLLLDWDPSVRIRFEVRARNEYFDLEPHLRRYRRLEGKERQPQ